MAVSPRPPDVVRFRTEFIDYLYAVLERVDAYNRRQNQRKPVTLQAYVWSNREQLPPIKAFAVRARSLRGERLGDADTRAYARKYDTKASVKWVRGFAEPHRSAITLELLPLRARAA
jgi:hypothetical protein